MLVAEVQDSLFMVIHDLNRLDGLLAHTMENLMLRFSNALSHLESAGRAGGGGGAPDLDAARGAMSAAVIELQFQDIASQLIAHSTKTLQGCAYRLAAESMGSEDGEAIPFVEDSPQRPNPVTQGEMDAGSAELF